MASITVTKKKQKQKIKEPQIKITWKEIKRQKVLLIWSAIIVVYGVIFCYLPLGGWLMAFQNYKPKDGLLHSSFVGLAKFQQLFSDATFLRVIRNTLAMGVINLVVTFVMAIVFAILLNEVKSQGGKKVVQTISYLPHFLSWIIVTGILHDALSTSLSTSLHIRNTSGRSWHLQMYGKRQDGMRSSIYLRSQQSILHSMKLQIWMVRAAGQESNMSHFPELSRRS